MVLCRFSSVGCLVSEQNKSQAPRVSILMRALRVATDNRNQWSVMCQAERDMDSDSAHYYMGLVSISKRIRSTCV